MPVQDSGKGYFKALPSKNPPTDAIKMLKDDHRKVEKCFGQVFEGDSTRKREFAEQLFHELEIHSVLEEEIFYPALEDTGHTREFSSGEQNKEVNVAVVVNISERGQGPELSDDMICNAYYAHAEIRDPIAELRQQDMSSPEFQQAMIKLQQTVSDHVLEEEELFAEAQLRGDTRQVLPFELPRTIDWALVVSTDNPRR